MTRAIIRITLIVLCTAILHVLMSLGFLATIFVRSWRYAWRGIVVGAWARLVLGIIGMELVVRGRIPTAPAFVVSNHLSYVDVIVFRSILRCVFVSKAEVRSWPVVGRAINTVG